MARNTVLNQVKNVAKESEEKANVITVKMINNDNLIDYPKNNEDVTNTIDLEKSIQEIGFTDPIEVTTFNMDEGKYMILSGHRRRTAGVKSGIRTFPCVVRNFKNDEDVWNYVLLSNSQRDSSKDPLLLCKRYKMHEEYLHSSDFTGNIREEIANRLGISMQQADRYNQMNKIIYPVWDLIRDEKVGMSSVLMMSSHPEEEQQEIYNMLIDCMNDGNKITRDLCENLIKAYRNGIKNYSDYSDMTDNIPVNRAVEESSPNNTLRPEEVNRENSYFEEEQKKECPHGEDENGETLATAKKEKPNLTEIEIKHINAAHIAKSLEQLENSLAKEHIFEKKDEIESTVSKIGVVVEALINELQKISEKYQQESAVDDTIESIITKLDSCYIV